MPEKDFQTKGYRMVEVKNPDGTVTQKNMWDLEAKYYSLMTLMEVNGTNLQLDAIPLQQDDVVLDCGCGPGRVAIQAAKRVKKVICLDASEGMLEECKKNCAAAGVENVEFVLADWQLTEIGNTTPEVDVIIQSRGGGGPSTFEMLEKAARRIAVNIMWAKGAPNLPMSRGKLFKDVYSEEAMEKYPELKPFERRKMGPPPGADKGGPGRGPGGLFHDLYAELEKRGIEKHVTTIDEGWDKWYATKEEAYDDLIALSRHPEEVEPNQFRKNVDQFLTEIDGGWYFFLPTQTDITWFETRPNKD
ncbi:MAG: class I SAM-dependent methyltransferase [Clostridia bacterium]|nr:class I SAM-dependent methyltransferase [Clostridia bacterium]